MLVILFAIIYLILLVMAIACFAALGYVALMLIISKPMFATLALGIGLFASGGFIVYYMIKFLFSSSERQELNMIELNLDEEPELKNVILDLTQSIGTKFPKKVLLSYNVNASVFYTSSFWSMFFPVRKNLNIGLGLVNGVTVSEFKGILAHEFGHFSQRSMAVGSYVHNVNKVIHNLLYDNESYNNTIASWSNASIYFKLVNWLAFVFNSGVQFVLRQMYSQVNKGNLALSREMEFHADAVGATYVGTKPMIDSLLRMNLVSDSLDQVVDYYNGQIRNGIKPDNIFSRQTIAMNLMAQRLKLPLENNFPYVSAEKAAAGVKSYIRVKDLWASHPSDEDRILSYKSGNYMEIPADCRPAGILFSNLKKTQEEATAFLYRDVTFENEPVFDSGADFEASFTKEINDFPECFNGYYDNHNPLHLDLDATDASDPENVTYFGTSQVALLSELATLQNDLNFLEYMTQNPAAYRNFEYESGRYSSDKASLVAEILAKKMAETVKQIQQNDKDIYAFFRRLASEKDRKDEFRKAYDSFYKMDAEFDRLAKKYTEMHEEFEFAYQNNQPELIHAKLNRFYHIEDSFCDELSHLMKSAAYKAAITDEATNAFNAYISDRPRYFTNDKYNHEAINQKAIVLNLYMAVLQRAYVQNKKKLLGLKAELMSS
ncbi:M48 family metallopeptidase [Flavobacterium silvaticum]|uniref:M48 family metalloprotease n=1 Tax=Flavobacterium silvaticum TaxID=1852020 RepID=A0A972FSZ1_9FLAO|nr:M48 family metallopeptidase [Flavobacterium silvaticum]NMH28804.1 M48 family metalloprotease [Flavobacterium silvaticum]